MLHVGCGPKRKDRTTRGFNQPQTQEIRLEMDPAAKPDVVGTMTDMQAVGNGSGDAIFSSHNIEHLYPHEVPQALREFRRVLRADGLAVITCPDLQSICALVVQDRLTDKAYQSPSGPITPLDMLYGHCPALARGNLYMAHRCGLTARVLGATLREAGIAGVAVRVRPAAFGLWAQATMAALDDTALRALAEHFPA